MPKTNLTIQLDAEVIRRARVVAAKQGSSVSALVARELSEMVDREERYEDAHVRAKELMRTAEPRGGLTWRRDEIHDRNTDDGK